MTFEEFLATPKQRNAWVEFVTPTGAAEVYIRRHIAHPRVLMVANINSLRGFGSAKRLYTKALADIPTIAENVINGDLDRMLDRWGWTTVFHEGGIPTRTNPCFDKLFGTGFESPIRAIMSQKIH